LSIGEDEGGAKGRSDQMPLRHGGSMSRIAWWVGILSLVLSCIFTLSGIQPAEASSSSYPPFPNNVLAVPPACTHPTSIPAVPVGQVQMIEQEVTAFVGDHFEGLGQCGYGLLVLTLTPGSETTAQRARAKFGPSIQIMVGLTVWNGHPGRSPRCGTLASPSLAPAGYSATLDLRSRRIEVGGNLKVAAVRNTSTESVRVLTSSVEAVITKLGTGRVVGVYSGGIAGEGLSLLLSPGQSQTLGVVGGTASCDGGIGSALPPGRYNAVAEVSGVGVDGPAGPGDKPPPTVFTQFVRIQIVPR
jgi:hypothetical protein